MTTLAKEILHSIRSVRAQPTFSFNGSTYPLFGNIGFPQQSLGQKQEELDPTFLGYTTAYKGNGPVFSVIDYRRQIFQLGRFQWQRVRGGVPGDMFGTEALSLLEHPKPGQTTADLLGRAIMYADLAGNAFLVRHDDQLDFLRPDWVTIVAGSRRYPDAGLVAPDAEVVGYAYYPGGKSVASEPIAYDATEVAHFAPVPDPAASFRGMSWLSPIVREIMGDSAATTHKLKFFENGATPNLVVSLDPAITLEKFEGWVEQMEQNHAGLANAYRTLYLGGGADVDVIGRDMRQVDFKVTQGAGESRIAAAGHVPPVLVGFSEGMQGSSLNAGNYESARRNFAEGTIWPLWENLAGSLEVLLPPPAGARLWMDTTGVAFFQEDAKDRAEIQQLDATAIRTLVDSGYTPDSVIDAVTSNDLSRLLHSGLYSVQLQPPGQGEEQNSKRALVERTAQELEEAGVKPTQEAIAEALDVNDRTVRRWLKA